MLDLFQLSKQASIQLKYKSCSLWTELSFSETFRAPLLYRRPDLSQIENVRKINPGHREARAIDFYISNVSGLAEFLCWTAGLWGRPGVPACCQTLYSCRNLQHWRAFLFFNFFRHSPQSSKDPCRYVCSGVATMNIALLSFRNPLWKKSCVSSCSEYPIKFFKHSGISSDSWDECLMSLPQAVSSHTHTHTHTHTLASRR